ncbi:MAG: hypothetical protein FD149_2025 [Rhodospirillaceae bacterium]|nr:MAG: hypothetical protein FD149_2025 [Rhodospirillaceae bacterium]
MNVVPYVLISLLGGAIVPVQIAITNALRNSSGASQIQATFVLYTGGMLASLLICYVLNGGVKPSAYENTS